ncbi:autoinducer 2 ABC transporter substrate-binding protein [Citrobacter farmeri]|nr:autoinducer 2 ABC transporter substrate-binding protein [Raoultella planticola]EKX4572309.1 autoinducer 2 ABC transporter substrate-binding protein [Enterobacter hormaechei]EKZ9443191.1 autoinducer 2 ABC transporter substrate-binding protein [Enterobacter hormaechei]ELJ2091312.1 autoinducer 2 ABC transporter substrate-binding protein [Enterobacter hormaechei]MDU2715695.1 autoinducer 2 ABC transporter substrate-binding protein [Klebsiella michiganensis]
MKIHNKLAIAVLVSFSALCTGVSAYAADETYSMVGIPKLRSAWFNDYEAGLKKAEKDFGIKTYFQAPASADEQQQVSVIRDSISQGNNALLVVPNNASSVEPVFKQARTQNIVVITHESVNQKEADYDVEMIENQKFGSYMMDQFAKHAGEKGEFAIYVGSLTVPAHNIWADAAIKRMKEKYPQMKLVAERFPVSEDRNASRQKTLELIATYPDMKGVLSFGSQGAPGAGQALREKGMVGKLTVIGTTSPKESARFLEDGAITESILWSPGEASYAMAYIAKLVLDGKRDQIKQGLEVPGLGKPEINGMNIIFDKPLTVTKENYKKYDF